MKLFLLLLIIAGIFPAIILAQVSINTDGSPADNSSMLEIKSTTKGFLSPRMTQAQIVSIPNPANGLLVYSTTDDKMYIFVASLNQWKELAYGSGTLALPSTYSIGSGGSCSNTSVQGSYNVGYILNDLNYVSIQVSVSTVGTYTISTNLLNGYSFSKSGIFTTTGYQTVDLMGIGTPLLEQTDTFIANATNGGGTCTFTIGVQNGPPNCGVVIDSRDGKSYNTVVIGSQCWMSQNMNIGTRINALVDQSNNSILEKYCYDDIESNCDIYGGLYQWAEMVQYLNGATNTTSWNPPPSGNVQGLCPQGWHVPSDDDWTQLTTFLGGESVAGGAMKETGTIHWVTPNIGATNLSGFTSLPGGDRGYDANWYNLTYRSVIWSSSQNGDSNAWYRILCHCDIAAEKLSYFKVGGFSLRCLQD
jgi:uncharacterized protein (TIGR02145 family)